MIFHFCFCVLQWQRYLLSWPWYRNSADLRSHIFERSLKARVMFYSFRVRPQHQYFVLTPPTNVRVLLCVRHCARCWLYIPQRAKQSLCSRRADILMLGPWGERDRAVNKLIHCVGDARHRRKQTEMGEEGLPRWVGGWLWWS